jgi:hypothetical protein
MPRFRKALIPHYNSIKIHKLKLIQVTPITRRYKLEILEAKRSIYCILLNRTDGKGPKIKTNRNWSGISLHSPFGIRKLLVSVGGTLGIEMFPCL